MTNEIFSLELAGINAWDVFTKHGRYAGLIVTKADGTLRHYYDSNCSRGSARKFQTIEQALDNIRARRAKLNAKRAA